MTPDKFLADNRECLRSSYEDHIVNECDYPRIAASECYDGRYDWVMDAYRDAYGSDHLIFINDRWVDLDTPMVQELWRDEMYLTPYIREHTALWHQIGHREYVSINNNIFTNYF
jgi:hypothetical protein